MGLWDWFWGQLGFGGGQPQEGQLGFGGGQPQEGQRADWSASEQSSLTDTLHHPLATRPTTPSKYLLTPTRVRREKQKTPPEQEEVRSAQPPYEFARFGVNPGTYLNLAEDGNPELREQLSVPHFETPRQLATWLGLPLGKVAWLTDRFTEYGRSQSEREAHYHYHWLKKASGGHRLIESPKSMLKAIQEKILVEILDQVATHDAAHGFVPGRSILTNARLHVGHEVLLKQDLQNFYTRVRFSRVVAIFRSIGYSREAAIWLARLTTSAVPTNLQGPSGDAVAVYLYFPRHLPQGAPTSPALANLSAYVMDVRLSGLAKSFGATYTRYADDLTFSGDKEFGTSLKAFIPLSEKVIRQEGFYANLAKRKVIRGHQRQTVTGIVVNDRVNVTRREFDRLKAILTNCERHGARSQNREQHPHFREHLRGRIAHVQQSNAQRAEKLLAIFERVDWLK